jgi:hypothetical protein
VSWIHAPLISPAVGAYCLIALAAVCILWRLFERARKPTCDPHAEPYGDQ